MEKAKGLRVYVGTYAEPQDEGIHLIEWDAAASTLKKVRGWSGLANPSYLASDPARGRLYAVSETAEYEGARGGSAAAYAVDPTDGELLLLGRSATHGEFPCYISVERTGERLFVANYGSGSLAWFPLANEEGLPDAAEVIQHSGRGPNAKRQEGPHAHSIAPDPTGRYVISADLGIDKLLLYRLDGPVGTLPLHREVPMPPGTGPRHFVFHPDGNHMYVISELASTVTVFKYKAEDGELEALQTISTLPESFVGSNTGAEIQISPDGRFLYASNRGHDSIAVFAVETGGSRLELVGHHPSGGKTPRNFALTPDGDYVLSANQDSDRIVVYPRDRSTGLLGEAVCDLSVPKPVCIRFWA